MNPSPQRTGFWPMKRMAALAENTIISYIKQNAQRAVAEGATINSNSIAVSAIGNIEPTRNIQCNYGNQRLYGFCDYLNEQPVLYVLRHIFGQHNGRLHSNYNITDVSNALTRMVAMAKSATGTQADELNYLIQYLSRRYESNLSKMLCTGPNTIIKRVFKDEEEVILSDYIEKIAAMQYGLTKISVRKLAYRC
ncbi:hypothetical protein WDU94_013981 [Cyamophila willieti]